MDATLEHFEALKAAHRDVAGRTRALADGCGRLVAEEEALAEFAGARVLVGLGFLGVANGLDLMRESVGGRTEMWRPTCAPLLVAAAAS